MPLAGGSADAARQNVTGLQIAVWKHEGLQRRATLEPRD
jgi:hypothetical protein